MSQQRYEVTHVPHFINGRLVHPGVGDDSIVTLPDGVKPGRWLKPVGQVVAQDEQQDGEQYAADHISRGDYCVVRVADGSRASVVFKNTGKQGEAKGQAEAEAARLNAGGEPAMEPLTEPAHDEQQDGGAGGTNLPDA